MIPNINIPTVGDIQQAYQEGEFAVIILFFDWALDVIGVIDHIRKKLNELYTFVNMDDNENQDI